MRLRSERPQNINIGTFERSEVLFSLISYIFPTQELSDYITELDFTYKYNTTFQDSFLQLIREVIKMSFAVVIEKVVPAIQGRG